MAGGRATPRVYFSKGWRRLWRDSTLQEWAGGRGRASHGVVAVVVVVVLRAVLRAGASPARGYLLSAVFSLLISDWPHLTRKTNRQLPGGPRKWGPFYSPHCKFRSECGVASRHTRQEDRASAAYFPVWLIWLPAEVQRHYALHRRRLTWLEAWGGTATVLNAGLWWTQIVGGGRSQRGGRFQHRSRFQHTRESSLPRLQHNMERSLATRHAASTCQPSGLINSDHAAFAGT